MEIQYAFLENANVRNVIATRQSDVAVVARTSVQINIAEKNAAAH